MTIYDLVTASFIAGILILIIMHVNISRTARGAAKRYCEQHGVQFLDQNVVLNGVKFARSTQQLFAIQRRYYFEFSSVGDHRYQGIVVMLGNRIDMVELEPFKTLDD